VNNVLHIHPWSSEEKLVIPASMLKSAFTAADARADNNWALHLAHANGHESVVRWLDETFNIRR
jgi:hypothetical protein